MRSPSLILLASSLLLACDSTVFGDSVPGIDSPFSEGQSVPVEQAELAAPVALVASQRWPGTLYALADEGASVIHALDDQGKSQGQLNIADLPRGIWRDLAVNNEQLLILDVASAQLLVHHISEPDSPPPFDATLDRLSTQPITVAQLALPDCRALATGSGGSLATLMCNEADFYQFELNNADGAVTVASPSGSLDGLASTPLDFSVSPGGQFGLLTFADELRVAQSSNADWASAFASGGRQALFDDEAFVPASSSFAFNSILLHSLGSNDSSGLIFSIFNP